MRHGEEYLCKVMRNADLMFLQRYPMDRLDVLHNEFDGKVKSNQTYPSNSLYNVSGRSRNISSFSNIDAVALPSSPQTSITGDKFQGSIGLAVTISNVNFVNVLPCYQCYQTHEYPITVEDTFSDIEFLLKKFSDTNTIMFGDFHISPKDSVFGKQLDDLFVKYKYKSYLDDFDTFKNSSGKVMNLDRCISNFNIEISDVCVHTDVEPFEQGHYALRYELKY